MVSPRINLLPPERRGAAQPGWRPYLWAGAALAVAAGALYYYHTLLTQEHRLLAAAQALAQEHEAVRAELQRAGRLKEREEKAVQAEGNLRSLRGRSWWPAIVEFANLTPGQGAVWEVVEGAENRIRIQGAASGMTEVAQLATGLAALPYVEGVDVHYARERAPGHLEFALTVRLAAGEGR